jgi:3-carboxy-cis,cis-muconate cycloisomerase
MPASPLDSVIYRDLFGDAEVARLFTDSAEVRAMMLVEGALAKVQGKLGVIPELSGTAIHRASLELQLDPEALTEGAGKSGVPIPALVAQFRDLMQAPEHAQYLHWGATSQDIIDTALALRLRQSLSIFDARLRETARALADLAEAHARLAMVGRTFGQAAVPTSFGAMVAAWGQPILRHLTRLQPIRDDIQTVSLSGAAGTLSAMGNEGSSVRAGLAEALGLGDPGASRHATRDAMAALAAWMTGLSGSLGKMGVDLVAMTQSGIDEVALATTGGSSTMPQKSNPVLPSLLVAIATQNAALNSVMQQSLVHRQQRDGTAWFAEWLSLPQMVLLTARSTAIARELARSVAPNPAAMSRNIAATNGLMFAEALTFTLAKSMPRPKAEAAVKQLCAQSVQSGKSLTSLAKEEFPSLDFGTTFDASAQLGQAPSEALAFAKAARTLTN